jgi:hypothetical protein
MPRQRSAIHRDLRTPKYRMRVERDRTVYYRKTKHRKAAAGGQLGFRPADEA